MILCSQSTRGITVLRRQIQDDISRAPARREGTFLVLLDLSTAFDTIDHNILLFRLERVAGIQGAALQWLGPYLAQSVVIDGIRSAAVQVRIGVPQGSAFAPLLFLVYTQPLHNLNSRHKTIHYHGYADDRQIYKRFPMRDTISYSQDQHDLEVCVEDICDWMLTTDWCSTTIKQSTWRSPPRITAPKLYQRIRPCLSVGGLTVPASQIPQKSGCHPSTAP